jgi:hypothetical protein
MRSTQPKIIAARIVALAYQIEKELEKPSFDTAQALAASIGKEADALLHEYEAINRMAASEAFGEWDEPEEE